MRSYNRVPAPASVNSWVWVQVPITRAGQELGPSVDKVSTNRCGGSNSPGWCAATQRSPPGSPSTARPSARLSASAITFIGCQGGTRRRIAPGLVCQAKTSSSGWSMTPVVFDAHA